MRDPGEVQLERGVLHVVDHREKEPVLSRAELSFQGAKAAKSYFQGQIRNALADSAAAGARFDLSADPEKAPSLCRALLGSAAAFLDHSQSLARLLFAEMKKKPQASPGTLAVFLYRAQNYPGRRFLALLKLDTADGLAQEVVEEAKGAVVRLHPVEDVLPATRERLQKAAIVQVPPGADDPDLILLDRQTQKTAADFFARGFLQCSPVKTARDRTSELRDVAMAAYNKIKGRVPANVAENFLLQTQAALRAEAFDLDAWLPNVGLPEEVESEVAEQVRDHFDGNVQFELDPGLAESTSFRSLHFRGAFGVRFYVDADNYQDVVIQQTVLPNGRTRLVLEVPDLKWVKQ